MNFLSIDNFNILSKVLKIEKQKEKQALYHVMKYIDSSSTDSLLNKNKSVINLHTKSNVIQETNPLHHLELPDAIKNSYFGETTDRNTLFDNNTNYESGSAYMYNVYKDMVNYYKDHNTGGISRGIGMYVEKPERIVQMERDLFRYYQHIETIVFDSRDRNWDHYPNSNSYRINFNKKLEKVHTIEIVSSEIPKTGYIVNDTNNTLYFQETPGITLEATIPNGNYTIQEILSLLEVEMESVGGSAYTLTLVNNDTRVRVSSDLTGGSGIFNLVLNGGEEDTVNGSRSRYYGNNIGVILGYSRNNLSGSPGYTTNSNYNVSGIDNIYLTLSNLHYKRYYTNDGFIKLSLEGQTGDVCFYKYNSNKFRHEFWPIIESLEFLDFRWTDYNDVLYDFNGREHSITMRFISFIPR
jgi:hypothetical protein